MHIRLIVALTLLAQALFPSCSKDDSKPELKKELRLSKIVIGAKTGDYVSQDSLGFEYNNKGQLSKRIILGTGEYQTFTYDGELLTAISSFSSGGQPGTITSNPMTITNGGNTITLTYLYPRNDGDPDTARLTYNFLNDVIQSYKLYLDIEGNPPIEEIRTFTYDPSGNLKSLTQENFGSLLTHTTLQLDNFKNPFHKIKKVNYLFLGGIDQFGTGVNNILKAELQDGTVVDYKWTYNEYGYPQSLEYQQQGSTYTRKFAYEVVK